LAKAKAVRDFRVFYAGNPTGAVQLSAVNAHEAAYLFFSNEPRKASIFVEVIGKAGDTVFTYSELSGLYPDVPAILAAFEGQKDVIADALVRDRKFTNAVQDDSAIVMNQIMRRFKLAIVGVFVLIILLVKVFLH